jgi:hypothetical protein
MEIAALIDAVRLKLQKRQLQYARQKRVLRRASFKAPGDALGKYFQVWRWHLQG